MTPTSFPSLRSFSWLVLLAPLALAALAPACSSPGAPVTTSDAGGGTGQSGVCSAKDVPSSCVSPAPSWANDVMPIFAQRCWGCHADGGVEAASADLGSYAKIAGEKTTVFGQVANCRMPPADADQLTTAERATLLHWFVCGAPNP